MAVSGPPVSRWAGNSLAQTAIYRPVALQSGLTCRKAESIRVVQLSFHKFRFKSSTGSSQLQVSVIVELRDARDEVRVKIGLQGQVFKYKDSFISSVIVGRRVRDCRYLNHSRAENSPKVEGRQYVQSPAGIVPKVLSKLVARVCS